MPYWPWPCLRPQASGCSPSAWPWPLPKPEAIALSLRLRAFGSCLPVLASTCLALASGLGPEALGLRPRPAALASAAPCLPAKPEGLGSSARPASLPAPLPVGPEGSPPYPPRDKALPWSVGAGNFRSSPVWGSRRFITLPGSFAARRRPGTLSFADAATAQVPLTLGGLPCNLFLPTGRLYVSRREPVALWAGAAALRCHAATEKIPW